MDDHQIITLFESRNQDAIAEVKRKYDPLCRTLAGKLLCSTEDVEECVNDVYWALWNAIPPAKPAPLSAFLAKVTRNLALKRLEYLSAEKRGADATVSFDELDACIPFGPTPESMFEETELAHAIQAFLQKQSAHNRIIFLRRYYFFNTVKEIAAYMGCGEEAVKSSLHRTRRKLKTHLIKEALIDER